MSNDDTIAQNTLPMHMLQRAADVINENFPDADAYPVDCIVCIEDHGPDLIDLGIVDAINVINDATVYGALPRGTYLEWVDLHAVRLTRQEVRA